MNVRCPHCHSQTELAPDSSFTAIECPSCGSQFNLAADAATATFRSQVRTIGHFQLVESLGSGNFGAVWKAKDSELDRTVAIKIPRKDQLSESESEQFFREARAAAQLRHPNIVTIHEVGRDQGTIFIASDYVQGVNLQEWLRVERPSARESAELCAKVADALDHAHERGVVHRDLKPGNIMLDLDREPHIMDFGLAKRESGEVTMTVDGQILGTPAYMSPEQARGEGHVADRRTDVFSLGVILYELLTGELPFRGEKQMLIFQILKDEPMPPRRINSRVPRDLETVCLKCLEKERRKRYRTAGEVAAELRRFLAGQPILARPISRLERGWRWASRNPLPATLGTLAALLLAAVAAVSLIGYLRTSSALELVSRREGEAKELAAKEIAARKLADAQSQLAQKREQEAKAASAKEAAAAARATELLARDQMARGVRMLQDGDDLGLLQLLAARETAQDGTPAAESAELLWAGWHESVAGRLAMVGGQDQPMLGAAFSPDGKLAASVAMTGDAQLWDIEKRAPHGPRVSLGNESAARAARGPVMVFTPVFNASGSRFALTGPGRVRVWEAATLRQMCEVNQDAIVTAAFDSNGELLTVERTQSQVIGNGADPAGIRLQRWNPQSGEKVEEPVALEESTGESGLTMPFSSGLAFTPDGKWLAAWQGARTVAVWNTQSGEKRGEMNIDTELALQVALSDDGRLAAASEADTVRVWQVDTGEPYGTTINHVLAKSISFSSDARFLATGSLDGSVKIWEVESGRSVWSTIRHQSFVTHVAIAPQGRYLLTTSFDSTFRMWDLSAAGSRGRRLPVDGAVQAAVFRPESHVIAVAAGNEIRMWDLAAAAPVGEPLRPKSAADAMLFSPDGARLAVWGADQIQLWDVDAAQEVGNAVPHKPRAGLPPSFSPDSRFLALRDGNDLQLIDARTGAPHGLRTVGPRPRVMMLRGDFGAGPFSPDGKLLLCQSGEDKLQLIVTETGEPHGEPLPHRGIAAPAFSPDGTRVATLDNTTVRLWDVARSEAVSELKHSGPVFLLQFSAAGDKLAVQHVHVGGAQSLAAGAERIAVWDLSQGNNGQPATTIVGGSQGTPILFSPDGRHIATSSTSGQVQLWDLDTGRMRGLNLNALGYSAALDFTPDGRLLLTQSADGTLRLWETSTGEPYGPPIATDSDVLRSGPGEGIEISPDGEYLMMAARQGPRYWRLPRSVQSLNEMEQRTWLALGVRGKDQGGAEPIPWREWRELNEALAPRDEQPGTQSPRSDGLSPLASLGASLPYRTTPSGPIPPRSDDATPNMLDLTPHYNASLTENWHAGVPDNTLREFPSGVQEFGGVQFDVRGIVQLAGRSLTTAAYPQKIGAIAVNQPWRRIHVLHAAGYSAPKGTRVASLMVNYANGHRWEIPILYGEDVMDWWHNPNQPPPEMRAAIVWTGHNPESQKRQMGLRLFKSEWGNPFPGVPATYIEYRSANADPAPFLIAITVE